MFKTTVHDGPQELWFQQEITEAGAVNSDIGTFLVGLVGGRSEVPFFGVAVAGRWSCNSWGGFSAEFLIGVVDEIFLVVGHLRLEVILEYVEERRVGMESKREQ